MSKRAYTRSQFLRVDLLITAADAGNEITSIAGPLTFEQGMFARQGLLQTNTRYLIKTISAPHTRLSSILKMSKPSNRRPDPPLSDSIWEMFSMKGKVVSITGGGGGIGFEVARAMAEAGADVAIWYVPPRHAG